MTGKAYVGGQIGAYEHLVGKHDWYGVRIGRGEGAEHTIADRRARNLEHKWNGHRDYVVSAVPIDVGRS
jgi:hypothetical protein